MNFLSLPNPVLAALLAASHRHWFPFQIHWTVAPLLALIAGIFILIRPKLLNFIVAIYLIVVGVLGLYQHLG